ncbi:hypothetical protein DIPPA_28081 [Diplonema papillatum]|nr:hypothetical protein DIPPA_28081 [Diplonema papillatum]
MLTGRSIEVREDKYREGLLPEADGFFRAVASWVDEARKDWQVMVARHRTKIDDDSTPLFSWNNKGPITDAFATVCGEAKKWHNDHKPTDVGGREVEEGDWFAAILHFCETKAHDVTEKITYSKLRIKYDDWRNGGAYWNKSTAPAPLAAAAPMGRGEPPPAKKKKTAAPPPLDPTQFEHSDLSRVTLRMRLFDALIRNTEAQSTPFSADQVTRLGLLAEKRRKAEGPELDIESISPPNPLLTSFVLKGQSKPPSGTPGTREVAARYLAGGATGEANGELPDIIVSEIGRLSHRLSADKFGALAEFAPPQAARCPSEEELAADDDDDDASSAASSEPFTNGYWYESDVPDTHPLHAVISHKIHPPGPAQQQDSASRGVSTVPPADWNAYLVATAIEEAAFVQLGGKTEMYYNVVKTVRKEVLSKQSTLRVRLLRHATSPESVVRLPPVDIPAYFRKGSVLPATGTTAVAKPFPSLRPMI